MAWLKKEGADDWKNVTGTGKAMYLVERGGSIMIRFSAKESWDEDGDEINDWDWDLDSDGWFGWTGMEESELTEYTYSAGTYELGLKVGDGVDISEAAVFTLIVFESPTKPDLTIQEIVITNLEPGKTSFDPRDSVVIRTAILNSGLNDTLEAFTVRIEVSYNGGTSYTKLEDATVSNFLAPSELVEVITIWNTGDDDLFLGDVIIRARADPLNRMIEDDEDNNEGTGEMTFEDTLPPEIIKPISVYDIIGVNGEEQLTLSGEATDNVNVIEVQYRIGSYGTWIAATGTEAWVILLTPSEMDPGDYVVEIRAYDGTQYSDIVFTQYEVEEKEKDETGFITAIGVVPIILGLGIVACFRRIRR